jgi:hypothetical protein
VTVQQTENAKVEYKVLEATECKLKAEFNMIMKQIDKIGEEIGLLNQRTKTEQAQTNASAMGENSILWTQRNLYRSQADGFLRDAEQKAAKMMIDTWNVRRTTDESLDSPNALKNDDISAVVRKMASGIGVAGT